MPPTVLGLESFADAETERVRGKIRDACSTLCRLTEDDVPDDMWVIIPEGYVPGGHPPRPSAAEVEQM